MHAERTRWPFKFSYIFTAPPTALGSLSEFGRALRRLRELGFEGAEISPAYPPGFGAAELAQVAAEADIRLCSVLTGWSYANAGLCLTSPDPGVRAMAVSRLIDLVGFAQRLGSLMVVGLMQGLRSDEPRVEVAQDRIAEGLQCVCQVAEDCGVTVVLEPVNHLQCGFNNTVGEVMGVVERVGSPALKPMVDTVHMNIEERSVTEPIYRVGKDLAHVHLCETNGGTFGSGHLDFGAVLRALAEVDYRGFVSVKIYRDSAWEQGAVAAMSFLNQVSRG